MITRVILATVILLMKAASPASGNGTIFNPYLMSPPPPPARTESPPAEIEPPAANEQGGVKAAPLFLYPKELGFGVAVAVPYDMFYLSGAYYLFEKGSWHRSPSYRGPWTATALRRLPPELTRYDLPTVRRFRDREFRSYWKDRERYRGKVFRPGRNNGIKRPN
ncbi:MAG TPA: hypothetical protein DCZ75_19480 [Geobacter sp.]|nr:hypothetical protein [Geobacter sp.]